MILHLEALTVAFHWESICQGISGLVAEYIVAIDVTRVRFPADALLLTFSCQDNLLLWC